jgi:hypothetical protein
VEPKRSEAPNLCKEPPCRGDRSTSLPSDVAWSQLVPLYDLGDKETLSTEKIRAIAGYKTSRRFHVPAWSADVSGRFHVADLLLPVATHKYALLNVAKVEARMSMYGWVLLHSCLVRFIACDDGRFD